MAKQDSGSANRHGIQVIERFGGSERRLAVALRSHRARMSALLGG